VSLFHRHQWQEVARRFVPPRLDAGHQEFDARGEIGVKLLRDLSNGYTVVELRCSECGDVTSRKLQGDAT
jgi:predicted deacetylase